MAKIIQSSSPLIGGAFGSNPINRLVVNRFACSAPCPSDTLTGYRYGKPLHLDCAGIRVLNYILKPGNPGKLIVKEHFGNSVSSDRCLVQARTNALTLAIEDESQYHGSVANDSDSKTEKHLSIFRSRGIFFLDNRRPYRC